MRTFIFLPLFLSLCCGPVFARITREEYQRAIDLYDHDQFDEAIAALKASLDADPGQPPIYNLLGMIYLKQNESIQSAIGSFEEAIRLDPNYTDAYFNLASLYAGNANQPELAAKYFKKTLEVDPKCVKAYFGLGWFTLTALEKPEEAAKYFEKAIDFFPNFSEAYYGLGLSYVQMGKAPMALQPISQLRALGREDLAAYLETVLRGSKIPEQLKEEVHAEPGLEATPPALQGGDVASSPVSPSKNGENLSGEAAPSESFGGTGASENSDPFN